MKQCLIAVFSFLALMVAMIAFIAIYERSPEEKMKAKQTYIEQSLKSAEPGDLMTVNGAIVIVTKSDDDRISYSGYSIIGSSCEPIEEVAKKCSSFISRRHSGEQYVPALEDFTKQFWQFPPRTNASN